MEYNKVECCGKTLVLKNLETECPVCGTKYSPFGKVLKKGTPRKEDEDGDRFDERIWD